MSPARRLRMGTRGSPLARAQSSWYARRLEAAHPGLAVESVLIKTSGDVLSEAGGRPQPAGVNVKAMFVK